ncbi:MAG: phosphoglycerate kinase [Bdellovibrionota bacterium]
MTLIPSATPAPVTPGLKGIKFIEELDIKEKRVFLRLDLNVPLKNGKITDDTRIREAIPTIQYCLDNKCKLMIASHLGRPEGFDKKYSLEPVAERLHELLNAEIHLIEDPASDAPKALMKTLRPNQIVLLENVRYIPGEQKNDEKFAVKLAQYADVYINDAFGASHRAHSTIDALPKLIKTKGVGFLMKKEIEMLDKVLYHYESPFIAILGGSKVSDKIGVLDALIDRVDTFIIGGAMAYTFMAALKQGVGNSRIEQDKVSYAKRFMEKVEARDKKVLLPIDHVCSKNFENPIPQVVGTPDIPDGLMALDIGEKSRRLFAAEIAKGKTVFWNGPMGVFEKKGFERGTMGIAKAVSECEGFTVVGGGDSVSALNESGYADKVGHISTGGGASLEYLQGDKLAGLEVLRTRIREPSP